MVEIKIAEWTWIVKYVCNDFAIDDLWLVKLMSQTVCKSSQQVVKHEIIQPKAHATRQTTSVDIMMRRSFQDPLSILAVLKSGRCVRLQAKFGEDWRSLTKVGGPTKP